MPTSLSHTSKLGQPDPVAILGAGPAGAAAVLALLQKNLPVIWLIRPRPAGEAAAVGEHLAPEARPSLARLGLEHLLESSDHVPCPGIVSHWGSQDAHEHDYLFSPFGSGWNLDRCRFDRELSEVAREQGAKILKIRSLESIHRSSGHWNVDVRTFDGRRYPIRAAFWVDATGRNAALARQMGSQPHRHDRLIGLFASLPARHSESDVRLLIEPMSDGWWYSLRLPGGRLIAVYLTDSDCLRSGIQATRSLWRERFSASGATQARAARNAEPQTFRAAPAFTQALPEMCGEGWLAVGDACMAFDPLSASGITKALGDGIAAADAISGYFDGHRDSLESYARSRRAAFVRYLRNRQDHYRQETRWPRSEFWRRRYGDSTRT